MPIIKLHRRVTVLSASKDANHGHLQVAASYDWDVEAEGPDSLAQVMDAAKHLQAQFGEVTLPPLIARDADGQKTAALLPSPLPAAQRPAAVPARPRL